MYRGLALLLGMNVEAVVLIIAALKISEYLNTRFPRSYNWGIVCYPVALLVMLHTLFFMFRRLSHDMQADQKLNKKNGEL